jgi:mxaJ protein
MSSASKRLAGCLIMAALALSAPSASAEPRATLKVCADPNNLPFSNERREGFENALAVLVARELHAELHYMWWPARRGFVRNTLAAHRCDVIMGVPAGYELVRTTRPYYRSSYVFVSRSREQLKIASWDDALLRRLRLGVHVVGDDYSGVPPAQLLARRGIVDNVRGYSIYGAYSEPEPVRSLIDAVTKREVDVAIAWGPLAAYYAHKAQPALTVSAVPASDDPRALPMRFDIALGVRPDDVALQAMLDAIVARRGSEMRAILRRYFVPLLAAEPGGRT